MIKKVLSRACFDLGFHLFKHQTADSGRVRLHDCLYLLRKVTRQHILSLWLNSRSLYFSALCRFFTITGTQPAFDFPVVVRINFRELRRASISNVATTCPYISLTDFMGTFVLSTKHCFWSKPCFAFREQHATTWKKTSAPSGWEWSKVPLDARKRAPILLLRVYI